MSKLLTVIGARPQFIKAASVSRAIGEQGAGAARIQEILVHTGQHYDKNMSDVFFEQLQIPKPAYNLGIGGGSQGADTGRMIAAIEEVLLDERPDMVLVYGDTNSTLAGSLAAVKLHIPIAHVEAGLRSFNRAMPEEINRVLTDHTSDLLFAPTATAMRNLEAENLQQRALQVGDVMLDASLHFRDLAKANSSILEALKLNGGEFALATCHRAENTNDKQRLSAILEGLSLVAEEFPVVLPLHPRTRKAIDDYQLDSRLAALTVIEPVSFLDMIQLEGNARVIITDSGGVQKEAFFFGVPCVTLRDETEWTETLETGANVLVGADTASIVEQSISAEPVDCSANIYGDGSTGRRIVVEISRHLVD